MSSSCILQFGLNRGLVGVEELQEYQPGASWHATKTIWAQVAWVKAGSMGDQVPRLLTSRADQLADK